MASALIKNSGTKTPTHSMRISVDSEEAVEYCIRQLALRAGVKNVSRFGQIWTFDSLLVSYGDSSQLVSHIPHIVIERVRRIDVKINEGPLDNHYHSLAQFLPSDSFVNEIRDLRIPRIFCHHFRAHSDPISRADNKVIIHEDLVCWTYFMLTRVEENDSPISDQHSRFPGTNSLAYRLGFLGFPIIDLFGWALASWIRALQPRWKSIERAYCVRLTHDVDTLNDFNSIRFFLSTTKKALLTESPSNSTARISKLLCALFFPEQSEDFRSLKNLIDFLEVYKTRSIIYFMTASASSYNSGYSLMRRSSSNLLSFLKESDHEIGLHLGYEAADNFDLMREEIFRFRKILGHENFGARHHYLRGKPTEVWDQWDELGLKHDSTMGYADVPGFRCGTCIPFPLFSIDQNRELKIIEYPLICMDTTFDYYQTASKELTGDQILSFAKICRLVRGTFTLLVHPSNMLEPDNKWESILSDVLKEKL